MALVRAESEASKATIEAIGAAFRVAADSPGITEMLTGLGKKLAAEPELQKLQLEHAHKERLQTAELAEKDRARRQRGWLLGTSLAVALAVGIAILVEQKILSHGSVTAISLLVSGTLAGLGLKGKPQQ